MDRSGRAKSFGNQYLRRRHREVLHTKNIGCFKANFSTPPLITLVLNVMIPACQKKVPRRWYVTIAIAYHLNGSAERHLKKVKGCQENDGCRHLLPRPTEK